MKETGETFTLATANAQFGNLIRAENGLAPFKEVDVLLLQEVEEDRDALTPTVTAAGFTIVHADFDLAIATRGGVSVVDGSQQSHSLMGTNGRGKRELGTISVTVSTPEGEQVDVATTHPTIPVRFLARNAQIRRLGSAWSSHGERFVAGGDYNHYPSPWPVDRRIREEAGLKSVLPNESTFPLAPSKHRWIQTLFGMPDGQLDDIVYRGMTPQRTEVVPMASDHKGIITVFSFAKQLGK